MHYAAKKGNIGLVKLLLNFHSECEIKNNDGLSAIEYSIRNNHTEIYKSLADSANKEKEEAKKKKLEMESKQEKIADEVVELNDSTSNMLSNTLFHPTKKNSNTTNSKSKNSHKNLINSSEYKRYALNLSGNGTNENNDVQVSIDIPCSFDPDESKTSEKNYMNDYLSIFSINKEIISNPIVHIDISDEDKKSKLMVSSEKDDYIKKIEDQNINLHSLNTKLKSVMEEVRFFLNIKKMNQINELNTRVSMINELQERHIVTFPLLLLAI